MSYNLVLNQHSLKHLWDILIIANGMMIAKFFFANFLKRKSRTMKIEGGWIYDAFTFCISLYSSPHIKKRKSLEFLKSFFYVFFHSAGYFDGLLACEMCLDSSLEDWILELIKEMHLHLHLNCLFLCIISCYLPISKGLPWLCDTSVE